MLLELEESQLVLIDFQARLMPVMHDFAAVIANAARLARTGQPCWKFPRYTEQNPSGLGATVPELTVVLGPAKARSLAKMQFSAVEEGLGELLRPPARAPQGNAGAACPSICKSPLLTSGAIVLAGCEAHICLLQTALDLLEDEFDVWVVTDACSARTERNRDAAFDRLAGAGVELVTTEMVAFEWLRSAEHPAFREAQALIK